MTGVTVVVPSLNSGWSLAETLQSISAQEDVDAKALVVDSGSTDSTLKICERFGAETLFEPPGNMYRAINAGLRKCDTEWVTYVNSDDSLYGDALKRLVGKAVASCSEFCYGGCDYIDRHGRFLHSLAPPAPGAMRALFRLGWSPLPQPATVYRRDLFERLGGFDESFRYCADYDFFVRTFESEMGVSRLDGLPVARFRLHCGQFSQTQSDAMSEEAKRIIEKNGLRAGLPDRLRLLSWKIGNAGNYMGRWLRARQLRER